MKNENLKTGGFGSNRRLGGIIPLVIGAILIALGATALVELQSMGSAAKVAEPSPGASAQQTAVTEESPWPEVNWDYWKSVNPDVIGWVSIPGTDVSYPVVQAPAENPTYYLTHDVHGNWNVYGAVYLDSDCAAGGLDSENAVIFGHHMNDGSMLAACASYSDASFLEEHPYVYLQTPEKRWRVKVQGAQVANGTGEIKRTSFQSPADLRRYAAECLDACAAKSEGAAAEGMTSMTTLCTCSYILNPSNERTLVYAWGG